MNFSISKNNFSFILSKSNIFISNDIKIYYNLNNQNKIGFIISKKFGSAIKRNLFKRHCRFIFLNKKTLKKKTLTLIIKPNYNKTFTFNKIELSFNNFLNNLS